MEDKFGNENKYHIMPASFPQIVTKRFLKFKELLKEDNALVTNSDRQYSTESCILFVNSIIKSIISNKENLSLFNLLSNSSIELMLDYLKSILASSHLTENNIKDLINGNKLNQHKILETLLLYVYKEYNKENTYLLNMFDCGEERANEGTYNLFRIRVLQIIRFYGYINEENRECIRFSDLRFRLNTMGYNSVVAKHLKNTISIFVKFSILETSTFGEDYQDNTEIILCDASYYYIDHLIFRYRYIETIIPDTILDYIPDRVALGGEPKQIHKEIEKFIEFIKRCEEKEDENQISTISPIKISSKMEIGYIEDRKRIMGIK